MSAAASKSASPIIGTSSNRFSSRRRRANRSSVRAPARTSITTTSVMTRSSASSRVIASPTSRRSARSTAARLLGRRYRRIARSTSSSSISMLVRTMTLVYTTMCIEVERADRLFAGDQGRVGGVLDEEVGEDAEDDDAGQGDADRHGEGGRRAGALDGGGLGRLGDPHAAGDGGVVEQGDHGHHAHEDGQGEQGGAVAVDGGTEHHELGVPAGQRRQSRQRQQEDGHGGRQRRGALPET